MRLCRRRYQTKRTQATLPPPPPHPISPSLMRGGGDSPILLTSHLLGDRRAFRRRRSPAFSTWPRTMWSSTGPPRKSTHSSRAAPSSTSSSRRRPAPKVRFELAGKRLGADVLNMSVRTSSVSKGETLIDTATTLNAMRPDILVVRHQDSGAAELAVAQARLLRGQCRRRQPRASHPGAARRAHHPPPARRFRGADRGHLRRHPA